MKWRSGWLPSYRKRYGPLYGPCKHSERFLERNEMVWVEGSRLAVDSPRGIQFRGGFPEDLLSSPERGSGMG